MQTHETIGFIGLGIMGRPMAENLMRKGCHLLVFDINRDSIARLTSSGAVYAEKAEIGACCRLVFTMLPDGATVQNVLFAPDGVAASLQKGSLVIDMSSVTPEEAKTCHERLAGQGVGFLDAPVSGGEPKAIDGTLSFMVGGSEEDFATALPYLLKMGAAAQRIGASGCGCIAKLANQIIVNLTISAVSEAMVFAMKAGVDPWNVYQAIRGGLAGSVVLDAKAPKMISRDFSPGGKLSINLKDIKNVMATAHAVDVPLPFTSQLLEVMQALKVDGHMDDDHSGLVQYFEKLAGIEVSSEIMP